MNFLLFSAWLLGGGPSQGRPVPTKPAAVPGLSEAYQLEPPDLRPQPGVPPIRWSRSSSTSSSTTSPGPIEPGPRWAPGFWSSRMGVEDLRYTGNTFVAEWKGGPPEVLAKIGLTQG